MVRNVGGSWTEADEAAEEEYAREQTRIYNEKKKKKWTTGTVRKALKEKDTLWIGNVIDYDDYPRGYRFGKYSQKFKDLKAELQHELGEFGWDYKIWNEHEKFMYTYCQYTKPYKDNSDDKKAAADKAQCEGECIRVLKQLADAADKYNLEDRNAYGQIRKTPTQPQSKIDALKKKVNDSKPKITQKMRKEVEKKLAKAEKEKEKAKKEKERAKAKKK